MSLVIEAIYAGGLLRLLEPLELAEQQRGRLTVDVFDPPSQADRQDALDALIDGLRQSTLHLRGPLPTRNELHHRDDRL